MSRPSLARYLGAPPSTHHPLAPLLRRIQQHIHPLTHSPPSPLLPADTPTPAPNTTDSALSLIRSQSTPSTGRYILARLHARTYLLHPRDILTVPTLRPMQTPGTTLSLTKILEVGSREFALRSPAANAKELKRGMEWKERRLAEFDTIPQDIVRCELTVLEHTKSPLARVVKKKRRKGYQKTIQSKQGWTRLRVGDIELGELAPPGENEGDIQI